MNNIFSAKRICRAGIIAALYVALTCAFGALSFNGLFQIRPAEALCVLPLFYAEAVPALFIGCMLSNVFSQFGAADIFGGSAVTLVAALLTFFIGKLFKEKDRGFFTRFCRVFLGGAFPILLNAAIIPILIVYVAGATEGFASAVIAYGWNFLSMLISESVWIYALGTPLSLFVEKMRQKGVSAFLDGKKIKNEAAR